MLLAAQPELVTPVLQLAQRVVTRHLLGQAGLKADEGHGGAVTPIQRLGSAANPNVHLRCLVLDGVYRGSGDGVPAFVEVAAPTDYELHALLQTFITWLMKLLTRRGVLVEDMGRPTWPSPTPTQTRRGRCGRCRRRPSRIASPSDRAPGRRC